VANSKETYILLSIYQNMYQNKYGKMPSLNKYREKWAMQDVIDSIGYNRAKELIEYYFTTGKNGHPLQFFFFNFDKIDIMEREIKKDKTNRRILQEATKKLVEGENE
jgi:hypothetical protein